MLLNKKVKYHKAIYVRNQILQDLGAIHADFIKHPKLERLPPYLPVERGEERAKPLLPLRPNGLLPPAVAPEEIANYT